MSCASTQASPPQFMREYALSRTVGLLPLGFRNLLPSRYRSEFPCGGFYGWQ